MDKEAVVKVFTSVFKVLADNAAHCKPIAKKIFIMMKNDYKIHPISLHLHDEMVKLDLAEEVSLISMPWSEEMMTLAQKAVEASKEPADVDKWANKLGHDIYKEHPDDKTSMVNNNEVDRSKSTVQFYKGKV